MSNECISVRQQVLRFAIQKLSKEGNTGVNLPLGRLIVLYQMQQQQDQNKVQENEEEVEKGKEIVEEKAICQFYVERKKRQCKFVAAAGSKYCPAHCSDRQDKIECPYEKGFFVSVKKFEKHLKSCPKIMSKQKAEKSQWFSKDINKTDENADQAHSIEISTLSEVSDDVIDKIVKKIITLYLKHFSQEQRIAFISSSEKENLENTTNDHLQAKLITEKAFENKLIAPEFVYVEFGAGKGILSYAIAVKIEEEFKTHSKNILLERESRRNKFDKFFRDNPYFQRYKGDVSDFDFKQLPTTVAATAIEKCKLKRSQEEIEKEISKYELIGICKHMCGEALDISVRGLLQGNSKGCILASCCHHLCKYQTYLNPKFFQREDLSPEEIQILFKTSSWGTRSHQFDPLPEDIFSLLMAKGYLSLQIHEKILIGRMCKRLIDAGRAEYLQGKVYRYCSDQLTPENYVIISRI